MPEIVRSTETISILTGDDIVSVRRYVRQVSSQQGFSLVDQTKIVTAASELARNTVIHGGGGTVTATVVDRDGRTGVRLIFEDHGPGIADVPLALKDGFTTGTGLGLGLGGARRLSNDFDITSTVGKGTRVTITRWR